LCTFACGATSVVGSGTGDAGFPNFSECFHLENGVGVVFIYSTTTGTDADTAFEEKIELTLLREGTEEDKDTHNLSLQRHCDG